MRIACLTHFYIEENRAGGELMLHALLKALVDAGHEVTAYITDTIKLNSNVDGVSIVYGARPDVVLDTCEYDAVVSQFQSAAFAMDSAKRRHKPFIYVVHNDMWQTSRTVKLLAPRDLAVYNSQWISDLNTTTARELVVHPPVDRQAIKTKTTSEYVTLVNLTVPKGADIFIALARRMPQVKFLGVKGGYWKDAQMDITLPNVTIIDNTPNMRDEVYAKSKVIIMPSTYETFGMVAAEAIASGIPVLATPTAGLKENLGDAGVYARRGTHEIDKWHDALHDLLTDKPYYKEVSKRSIAQSKVINTTDELKEFVKTVEGLLDANIRPRE